MPHADILLNTQTHSCEGIQLYTEMIGWDVLRVPETIGWDVSHGPEKIGWDMLRVPEMIGWDVSRVPEMIGWDQAANSGEEPGRQYGSATNWPIGDDCRKEQFP